MEYVPVRRLSGNRVDCLSAMMVHNFTRELQMQTIPRRDRTTSKCRNLWGFETLSTIRQRLIHRAGRLIRPQGVLTLVLGGNERVRRELQAYLNN